MSPHSTGMIKFNESGNNLALGFDRLGITKARPWRHTISRQLVASDTEEAYHVSRQVWATPLTALVVAVVGAFGVPYAVIGFSFSPLDARFLDRPRQASRALSPSASGQWRRSGSGKGCSSRFSA